MSVSYIGRFAPSPTGLLHLGSLYTAVASYLDAKAHNGKWLVRIEDLDPPREQPGASDAIIQQLCDHGLHSDDSIVYQSQRLQHYQSACLQLLAKKQAFFCSCSRKALQDYQGFYPGFCRQCHQAPTTDTAIRLQVTQSIQEFIDASQGLQKNPLPAHLYDDFIIKRKDQLFAYQLAVVIDDIAQDVNHIVRGIDILPSTFRQLALYQTLGHKPPGYRHLPVISFGQQKLSKQNHAPALKSQNARENLCYVLQLLGQRKPKNSQSVEHILETAIHHWQPEKIMQCPAIMAKV